LLDIAQRAGLPFGAVRDAVCRLQEHNLLQRAGEPRWRS
jgi:hypothetical protein